MGKADGIQAVFDLRERFVDLAITGQDRGVGNGFNNVVQARPGRSGQGRERARPVASLDRFDPHDVQRQLILCVDLQKVLRVFQRRVKVAFDGQNAHLLADQRLLARILQQRVGKVGRRAFSVARPCGGQGGKEVARLSLCGCDRGK